MTYKIAITGHTKGIGKSIYDVFKEHGHTVVGYSSSNGWDISNSEIRQNIVNQSQDFDIFINNAYAHNSQTDLLKMFIQTWENQNKMIVNMSSKLVFYPGKTNDFFDQYISDKKEQNLICSKRMYSDLPKVLNIIPGLVDTEMSKIFIAPKIETQTLANYIYDLIKYKDVISTQQVILDVPKLNWADVKIQDIKN